MRDIDRMIERLSAELPGLQIRQLEVSHSGTDDDGLWFMRLSGRKGEVQVESSYATCPFLIEADGTDERFTARMWMRWRESCHFLGGETFGRGCR